MVLLPGVREKAARGGPRGQGGIRLVPGPPAGRQPVHLEGGDCVEIVFRPLQKGDDLYAASLKIFVVLPHLDGIKTEAQRAAILEQYDKAVKKGREELAAAKIRYASNPWS